MDMVYEDPPFDSGRIQSVQVVVAGNAGTGYPML